MLFIFSIFMFYLGFPSDSAGKEPTCQWKRETQKIWVRSLDQEDALEKEIATHSSEPTCQWKQETQKIWVRSLDQEDALEKEIATHSSILAWKIPWTEKPGELHSMGSQKVGHDWACIHVYYLSFTMHIMFCCFSINLNSILSLWFL